MVMVLGVLFLLAIIVSTFVVFSRLSYQAGVSRTYSVRTDMLAGGVLNQVRTLIARDLEQTQEPFDHPRFDPWLASMLTDDQAYGTTYRYITRLDLADTAWNSGAGAAAGGRVPDNINMATAGVHRATAGLFVDANSDGIPDAGSNFYVDADGDGKADSLLSPIGGGVTFPDGTCAYMAVRVVDNAHLNPTQHNKWTPVNLATNWPSVIQDSTDGRVDWGWIPDSTAGGRFVPRKRLPHVSFRNLRNIASMVFGKTFNVAGPAVPGNPSLTDPLGNQLAVVFSETGPFRDNPDAGEVEPVASRLGDGLDRSISVGNGWHWDENPDFLMLSDSMYFPYEPGLELRTSGYAASTAHGVPGPSVTSAYADPADPRVPFTIEDDLALRTWNTDPRANKYAHLYRIPFGIRNLGGTPSGNPALHYERNFARMVSSVTRERTQRWMRDQNGNTVLQTPMDLRRLFAGSGDYDASGNPTALLMGKLNLLMQYFAQYGILANGGIDARGTFTTPAFQRRAQFLANLCEYMRGWPGGPSPDRPGPNIIPTAYNFSGTVVYGVCRQPFLSEIARDAGAATVVRNGQTRSFADVQLGVELYNPFSTPINLSRYQLVFEPAAGGGVTTLLASPVTIDLAPVGQIEPRGFVWIGTDVTATVIGASARLAPTAAQVAELRRMGPRVIVSLRCLASNNVSILMDQMDTRLESELPGGSLYRYTAGSSLTDPTRATTGVDFSDWDGTGATNPAAVRTVAQAGFVNNTGADVAYRSLRSGIVRPHSRPFTGSDYTAAALSDPLTATATNLSLALARSNGTGGALSGSPFTPGALNPAQPVITNTTPPIRSFAGNDYIFGTEILLANRGVAPLHGARFVNLGELAHVMTVGNGPSLSLTHFLAGASEYARTLSLKATGQVAVPPYTRPYTLSERPTPAPAENTGPNNWFFINFERQVKYDIYEGAQPDPGGSGLPFCNNARILDILSLYMGNGTSAATQADFAPYLGVQEDSSEDWLPDAAGNPGPERRTAYREGRININTAPSQVVACLPFPRCWHTMANRALINTAYSGDGATFGKSVWFAECLAGSDAANGVGYLNTVLANGRDPYFAHPSDVFLFAQGANPDIAGRYFNNFGLGWDAALTIDVSAGAEAHITVGSNVPWKPVEARVNPHAIGYQYPTNRHTFINGDVSQTPFGNVTRGFCPDKTIRDEAWATCTNAVSTRSDVFTAYVLIKLIRPTPGRPQPSNSNLEWQDLGETRMVAIIDRTNCVIDTATGRVDLRALPRVLGRLVVESQ
jgi:hypothetical protein